MKVIQTEGLTKFYGEVVGVRDLSLEVEEGEIFGFLGPNGAGKTTTILLLLGFLCPTRGRATIFGKDSWKQALEVKEKVGYLPEGASLYEGMTGRELLDYLGGLQGRDTPPLRPTLCERLGLSQVELHRKVKTFSRGMKQKLAIVQALQHDPPLLILDEPTEGLDPLIQHEFLQILKEFRERGGTLFFSSHILSNVEKLCDRVGIIKGGSLIGVQTMEELQRKTVRQMEVTLAQEVDPAIFQLPGVSISEQEGRRVRLTVQGDINPVVRELAKLALEDLVFERAHLEDIFLGYYQGREEEP